MPLPLPRGLSKAFPLVKSLGGGSVFVATLPLAVKTAVTDIYDASEDPSRGKVAEAANSTLLVGVRITALIESAMFLRPLVRAYRTAHATAFAMFRAATPNVSERVASDLARSVGRSAFFGASHTATRAAASEVARAAGASGIAQLNAVAAASAGRKVGFHAGTQLARSTARFVPVLNVANAVIDVGIAVSRFANPRVGAPARVAGVIMAVGSIVAATNVPILSQAGASVSAVASVAGVFLDRRPNPTPT